MRGVIIGSEHCRGAFGVGVVPLSSSASDKRVGVDHSLLTG